MQAKPERLPYGARLFLACWRGLQKFHNLLNGLMVGFFLGLLNRRQLNAITELYYDQQTIYANDSWNKSGLQPWEEEMLALHFSGRHKLLLVGAGGGRETLALEKMGFLVESYECNPILVQSANKLLQNEGLAARVAFLEADTAPAGGQDMDGAIVGWGAYMHIEGRTRRIAFLRGLKTRLVAGAPVLISFFDRPVTTMRQRIIAGVGSLLRRLTFRPALSPGDDLDPDYVHYFTESEIRAEFQEAGFNLAYYGTRRYGHAVGLAA